MCNYTPSPSHNMVLVPRTASSTHTALPPPKKPARLRTHLLQALCQEVEGVTPSSRVSQARGWIPADHEDHAQRVHLPAGWRDLRHLDGRYAQRPNVNLDEQMHFRRYCPGVFVRPSERRRIGVARVTREASQSSAKPTRQNAACKKPSKRMQLLRMCMLTSAQDGILLVGLHFDNQCQFEY